MTAEEEWLATTHDWTSTIDLDHLVDIHRKAPQLAPDGLAHLVLEVLAYAAEEAEEQGGGTAVVTLIEDGARVTDTGRGTDTRATGDGRVIRKPIMSTKDLRFFDSPTPPALPDGHPRRGISVVAALSRTLRHTNRRPDGSWTRLYERGVPTGELEAIPPDGTRGTTVEFALDRDLVPDASVDIERLQALVTSFRTQSLTVVALTEI